VGGFGKQKDWGTRGYVVLLTDKASHEETIVLAFRGTANLTNWAEDADFPLVPFDACPSCKVHLGFYESWTSVAHQSIAAVRALRTEHPTARLLITGHSLGAAMAVLAATHLFFKEAVPAMEIYTFGQPRVGNPAFRSAFNQLTSQQQPGAAAFRVVHWRDPIPLAPFQWMGYEHTATEVWYNEDSSNHTVCDGSGEDAKCSRSLPMDLLYFLDHRHYLDRQTGRKSCD